MQDKSADRSFGNIDKLVEEIPNKYLLVNTARVRAQQVVNGAEPLVDGANPEKAVSTAFAEIAAGRLEVSTEPAPLPQPEPEEDEPLESAGLFLLGPASRCERRLADDDLVDAHSRTHGGLQFASEHGGDVLGCRRQRAKIGQRVKIAVVKFSDHAL